MYGPKPCKGSGCSATVWHSGDLCAACAGVPTVRVCRTCGFLVSDVFNVQCRACIAHHWTQVTVAILRAAKRIIGRGKLRVAYRRAMSGTWDMMYAAVPARLANRIGCWPTVRPEVIGATAWFRVTDAVYNAAVDENIIQAQRGATVTYI